MTLRASYACCVLLTVLQFPTPLHASALEVGQLRFNGRTDVRLLGVDDRQSDFSWRLSGTGRAAMQSAYEIRVAASDEQLARGPWLWHSGKVASTATSDVRYAGAALHSGQTAVWQVRVWDAEGQPSQWSAASRWEMGLLDSADWQGARWIEHPNATATSPAPLFARSFDADAGVVRARLYLAGVGLHVPSLNGQPVTDEMLAPGYSNYQLSTEYRVYDVGGLLRTGANTLGVELGNGTANVHRNGVNAAVGRNKPYAWWTSSVTGKSVLNHAVSAGASALTLDDVGGYFVGGTINVDIGQGGERLESHVIAAIDAPPEPESSSRKRGERVPGRIVLATPLRAEHAAGVSVSGSGNPLAAYDASAGAQVTPRLIALMSIEYADGRRLQIPSDRRWRSAFGATITNSWYAGSDYDARREQPGWNAPGANLGSSARRRDGAATGWVDAGFAPPPNLQTSLVWRNAEPIRVTQTFAPARFWRTASGNWIVDFGQNFAGIPSLRLRGALPAGTVVRMTPAEALSADGVDQDSIAHTGSDVFASYTTRGDPAGERWQPQFHYFAMRYLQVSGLPADYSFGTDTVTGLQLHATAPRAGSFETSDPRLARIHRMASYSIMSNLMSVLTDCPGREKLAYGADYIAPMESLQRHFDLAAYLRTMQRHLLEGQSLAGPDAGNVALKTPVYDWGYRDKFGDEINWGNTIVMVPWFLHRNFGDTKTMAASYAQMQRFMQYIAERKAGRGERAHIVTGALGDWVSSQQTSGELTGTWGYYLSAQRMAQMAAVLGHKQDAANYAALADAIRRAFNTRFFDANARRYSAGEEGATQTAQALALDSALVEPRHRAAVVDALVTDIRGYQPHGGGPHFSAGHLGLGPLVRALLEAGETELLWDVLQQDTQPSYGYFMIPSPGNPDGFSTIGERWDRSDSQNHMILLQIEEWLHAGLAGLRRAPDARGWEKLLIQPQPVGNVRDAAARYLTPAGEAASRWRRNPGERHLAELAVAVPANTSATVRIPVESASIRITVQGSAQARYIGFDAGHRVYDLGPGEARFVSVPHATSN